MFDFYPLLNGQLLSAEHLYNIPRTIAATQHCLSGHPQTNQKVTEPSFLEIAFDQSHKIIYGVLHKALLFMKVPYIVPNKLPSRLPFDKAILNERTLKCNFKAYFVTYTASKKSLPYVLSME